MLDFEQLKKDIGKNIKVERKNTHHTQKQIADKVNKSRFWLTAIETGSNLPTIEGLYQLADVLNCSIYKLLPPEAKGKTVSYKGPEPLISASGTTEQINSMLEKVKNDEIRRSTRNQSCKKNH